MRSTNLFVAFRHDGETLVHAAGGVSDYATLCGLANDGDQDSGVEVDLPAKSKIDCQNCKRLFEIAKPHGYCSASGRFKSTKSKTN